MADTTSTTLLHAVSVDSAPDVEAGTSAALQAELGVPELSFPVTCHGQPGRLTVYSEGAFSFQPQHLSKAKWRVWDWLLFWRRRASAQAVAAVEVTGASREGSSVRVWYFPQKPDRLKPRRHLAKSQPFVCASTGAAQQAVDVLQRCGSWGGARQPRQITVIVNPKSGQGRARALYHKHVEPVLEAAGLKVSVVVTRHRGHATQLARQLSLDACDALVLAGGDGTVFEALQGLMAREDWQAAIQLPLALLPAGSGNALAANTGLWDLHTAAHAVCKGRQAPLDLVSVLQPPGRRYYSFLSINYGLITNLDIGTEHLRWMGAIRFTLGALQQILLRKSHAARIAILPRSAVDAAATGTGAAQAGRPAVSAASPRPTNAAALSADCPPGPPTPLLDALGAGEHVDPLSPATLPPGWVSLGREPVQLFVACNLPWLDRSYLMAPQAGLDTGHLDLVYTRVASRAAGLRLLLAAEKGEHLSLPILHLEKVSALVLEPVGGGTWLVLDGEAIPHERIYAEVHPRLARVLVAP